MKQHFKVSEALFHRLDRSNLHPGFAVRKYLDKGQTEQVSKTFVISELVIALTLLSRMSEDEKINLCLQLSDVDEDGCLSPEEIFKMIEVVHRLFAKETIDSDISSKVLLEELSREKAIRIYDWTMKTYKQLEKKCKQEYDGLVDFNEFKEVLNNMVHLKEEFLPRNINLRSVLANEIGERPIEVPDACLDDFLMFRYEMHLLFSDSSDHDKRKLLIEQESRNRQDVVLKQCPGLVRSKGNLESKLPQGIIEFNPLSTKYYKRVAPVDLTEKMGTRPIYQETDKRTAKAALIPKAPVTAALDYLHHNNPENLGNDEEEDVNRFEKVIDDAREAVEYWQPKMPNPNKYPVLLP